jgi:hypothetical protein
VANKIDITKLNREFEEALSDFVAASLDGDVEPEVILPRRARMAKARERLCSHLELMAEHYPQLCYRRNPPRPATELSGSITVDCYGWEAIGGKYYLDTEAKLTHQGVKLYRA